MGGANGKLNNVDEQDFCIIWCVGSWSHVPGEPVPLKLASTVPPAKWSQFLSELHSIGRDFTYVQARTTKYFLRTFFGAAISFFVAALLLSISDSGYTMIMALCILGITWFLIPIGVACMIYPKHSAASKDFMEKLNTATEKWSTTFVTCQMSVHYSRGGDKTPAKYYLRVTSKPPAPGVLSATSCGDQRMEVKVPPGVSSGESITVQAPDGQQV